MLDIEDIRSLQMIRKTNPVIIIIYLLQHLTLICFPFYQFVIFTHWKPVTCKDFLYQITNLKHHSHMMSISQRLIFDIVVIDCLLDLLMNFMQVIRHIYSLDAQSSNGRNNNQLKYSGRILSIDDLKRIQLGGLISRSIISKLSLWQCHIPLFQLISNQALQ